MRNARTIRSAVPLSIIHLPITTERAMTIPILPLAEPKASASRLTFVATSPGPRNLTRIAEVIREMNALNLRMVIIPAIVAIPMARMINGKVFCIGRMS